MYVRVYTPPHHLPTHHTHTTPHTHTRPHTSTHAPPRSYDGGLHAPEGGGLHAPGGTLHATQNDSQDTLRKQGRYPIFNIINHVVNHVHA